MTDTETKQQRMYIRSDSPSKQKLEREAAPYGQKSLSEATDEEIREYESLTLTEAAWDVFLDALENPPKPNAKFRHAFAEHKKHVQS